MSLPFSKALVTGGAGFIGSHLVTTLVEQGCRVTVLDNLSSGYEHNLEHVRDDIHFVQGDIRDIETLKAEMAGCEGGFSPGGRGVGDQNRGRSFDNGTCQ